VCVGSDVPVASGMVGRENVWTVERATYDRCRGDAEEEWKLPVNFVLEASYRRSFMSFKTFQLLFNWSLVIQRVTAHLISKLLYPWLHFI
jgi:hypothetical protein